MTRRDLAEKRVDKLYSMEQAIEMISLLNYDECITALKGVKRMPSVMYNAILERVKSLKVNNLDLITALMQSAVNC